MPPIAMTRVTINSVDARAADLELVEMDQTSYVNALRCDGATRLNPGWPRPQIVELAARAYAGHAVADVWSKPPVGTARPRIDPGLDDLLGRIARYSPYWLRGDVDTNQAGGRAILTHPRWSK